MEQIVNAWAALKYRRLEGENMSGKPNNPYAAGPVIEWKMTKEELEAYLAKHPIVYREELKPSPSYQMDKWA